MSLEACQRCASTGLCLPSLHTGFPQLIILICTSPHTLPCATPCVISSAKGQLYGSQRCTFLADQRKSSGSPVLSWHLLYRGGRLMLTVISGVTATGIGGRWAGIRCLQMLAQQPGPMGGEVCELIRQRDPESPLLRQAPASQHAWLSLRHNF